MTLAHIADYQHIKHKQDEEQEGRRNTTLYIQIFLHEVAKHTKIKIHSEMVLYFFSVS